MQCCLLGTRLTHKLVLSLMGGLVKLAMSVAALKVCTQHRLLYVKLIYAPKESAGGLKLTMHIYVVLWVRLKETSGRING